MFTFKSHIAKLRTVVVTIVCLVAVQAAAQTCTSSGTGNWSSVFNCSSSSTSVYTVDSGHTVTVNTNHSNAIDTLIILGTLNFNNGKKITLSSGGVVIVGGYGTVTGGNGGSKFVFSGGSTISGIFNVSGPATATGSSTSFSPSYLPVEFLKFEGSISESDMNLGWTTASESNNSHFEIQYSLNAEDWNTIDIVYSNAENGNSNHIIDYNYEVNMAYMVESQSYFVRLKQVDFDGMYTYSSTRVLTATSSQDLTVSYLTNNQVVVSYPSEFGSTLNIYNLKGKKVLTKLLFDQETITLDHPGMYLVECESDGQKLVKKIIIR